MVDRPVRVAVAGCGRVTREHHLPAIASLPDVTVVALADTDRGRLGATADRFAIPGRFATAHEMLEQTEAVDLVCVAVPPAAHVEIGLEALRRRLPVMIEKPLSLDLDEADRVVEAAAAAGVPGFSGFNLRRHRLVQEARQIIASGRLGPLRAVRSVFTSSLRLQPGFPDWRRRVEAGGGSLSELAVHHVDLWRHVLDREVARVSASIGHAPVREETVSLGAELEGNIPVSALFCQGTVAANRLEVYGAEGCLRLSLYRADGLEVLPLERHPGGVDVRVRALAGRLGAIWKHRRQIRRGGVYLESFRRHWAAIADALRRGTPPPSSLEDGRRALRVLVAARRSAARGTWEDVG